MPDISSFFSHHGKVTPKPPEAEEYKVIDASWLVKRLWWFTMKGCRYMPLSKNNFYTVTDIYALPDGKRAELIDGQIYDIAHPGSFHQEIVMELSATIRDYIKKIMRTAKYILLHLLFFSTKMSIIMWSRISLLFVIWTKSMTKDAMVHRILLLK